MTMGKSVMKVCSRFFFIQVSSATRISWVSFCSIYAKNMIGDANIWELFWSSNDELSDKAIILDWFFSNTEWHFCWISTQLYSMFNNDIPPEKLTRISHYVHWKLKRSVSAPKCQFSSSGHSLIQLLLEPFENNLSQNSPGHQRAIPAYTGTHFSPWV